MNKSKLFHSLILLLLSVISLRAQSPDKTALPQEPISGIIALFDQTPIVALGETHEHKQLYEFLTELVQTEDFYTQVNDVLIESGSALYQQTLDRYISGHTVPLADLQQVWLNTTQSPVDPWGNEVYYNFLKTIRELNQRIKPEHQIRVVAADPPIEWNKVHTPEDYRQARGSRNAFYSQTVINEVLKNGRKALLICGGAHFGYQNPRQSLINQRIEKEYPNSVTVVLAASGLGSANRAHESRLSHWNRPTLVKLKDTWIGELPGLRRRVRTAPAAVPLSDSVATHTPAVIQSSAQTASSMKQGFSDYLLYFGTPDEIVYGEVDAQMYLSDLFWQEMNRRSRILFNHDLLPETRKTGSLRPVSYNN